MPKSASGTKRNITRASTGSSTKSRTTTARKATTGTKARSITARASSQIKAKKSTGVRQTTAAATGRIKGTRARGEVAGSPWSELKQTLTGLFANAFADRKGQARGAAMRGPNRVIAEIDTHITAITRQSQNRQAQAQKLAEELNALRSQQSGGQMKDQDWAASMPRTEHTAPDQIAGQTQGLPASQDTGDVGFTDTAPAPAAKRRTARQTPQHASAE